MTIAVYAAPATEPLTIAEVMAHLRIDASNMELAPGSLTVALASPAAAGNCTAGAHRLLATFVTATGETEAGAVSAVVTVADAAVNGQIAVSAIPIGGSLVTARKIYMTAAGGSTYLLAATIANNTATTATINVADVALGAEAPATNTTGDPQLSALIATARQQAELELRRSLITQTLDLYLDKFPGVDYWLTDRRNQRDDDDVILLPPLQSVSTITYVDTAGATQTLAADQYLVDAVSQPARIAPAYGVSWPSTRDQANAVKVRFIAGYGAAAAVPACVKQWMLVKIAEWHPGVATPPSEYIDCLLDPERVTGRISG